MQSLILLLLFVSSAFATEFKSWKIEYQGKKYGYTLTETVDALTLKGPKSEVSLLKKPCNIHIVEKVRKEILDQTKKIVTTKNKKEAIGFIHNGKKSMLFEDSALAFYLERLPLEIQRFKLEEKMSCVRKP